MVGEGTVVEIIRVVKKENVFRFVEIQKSTMSPNLNEWMETPKNTS